MEAIFFFIILLTSVVTGDVMCPKYCNIYYEGCQTCNCTSNRTGICNDVVCIQHADPKCLSCYGNMEWQECGASCTPTCENYLTVFCTEMCEQRCGCPFDKPVLHNGVCIAFTDCPSSINSTQTTLGINITQATLSINSTQATLGINNTQASLITITTLNESAPITTRLLNMSSTTTTSSTKATTSSTKATSSSSSTSTSTSSSTTTSSTTSTSTSQERTYDLNNVGSTYSNLVSFLVCLALVNIVF